MSMSTHVVGFRPPDEKWRKMKDAWEACARAGIEIPRDVLDFFNGEQPDECGVEVSLLYPKPHACVSPYKADMRDGFEIDITKLPPGVTVVRFYNSY